jgi:hypothetical protein
LPDGVVLHDRKTVLRQLETAGHERAAEAMREFL